MDTSTAARTVRFEIWRQSSADQPGSYELFDVPYTKGANVISCLMEIQRNPVTVTGRSTSPVTWDCNCLEAVCGSCSMLINGKVQLACTALIHKLEQPIRLEPMRKFPIVRDLTVNRTRMFQALKQVKAWVALDGTHNLGPGPRQSPELQSERYVLSTCITCGSCLEACPQISPDNDFIGAAAISQALLFNLHPSGANQTEDRVRGLMAKGGIQDCGKAQNCVKVCPKEIPLTSSIAKMNREVTKQVVKELFVKDSVQKHKPSGPA